jgi:hypothetical protein
MAVKLGTSGNRTRRPGFKAFLELDWILEKTPAQVSFFMFLLQAFIFITAAAFASKVSNHIILTLDIIYLLNILLLILYHNIKIATGLSVQKA